MHDEEPTPLVLRGPKLSPVARRPPCVRGDEVTRSRPAAHRLSLLTSHPRPPVSRRGRSSPIRQWRRVYISRKRFCT
jgi:hypothetical protein